VCLDCGLADFQRRTGRLPYQEYRVAE